MLYGSNICFRYLFVFRLFGSFLQVFSTHGLPRFWCGDLENTDLLPMEFSQITIQDLGEEVRATKLPSDPNQNHVTILYQ